MRAAKGEIPEQLKITTGYSIRDMLYLYQKRGQVVTSEELAKATAISPNCIYTAINNLKSADYVETIRGVQGGCRIAEPADDVSLNPSLSLQPNWLCRSRITTPRSPRRISAEVVTRFSCTQTRVLHSSSIRDL